MNKRRRWKAKARRREYTLMARTTRKPWVKDAIAERRTQLKHGWRLRNSYEVTFRLEIPFDGRW